MIRNTLFVALLATGLVACGQNEAPVCRNDSPGFLITNVDVIDGSGSAAVAADVRINDGLIADIGNLDRCEGEAVIDGGGQTLTPGFIDTHTHADTLIFEQPDALAAVSQGITTAIAGQEAAISEGRKVRTQLNAIAGKTLGLAQQGNQSAAIIIKQMKAAGVNFSQAGE